MARTEQLRRQHAELTALTEQLAALLDEDSLARNADAVRRLLATFTGLLGVHTTMEDKAVYPRLLAHRDPAIRDAAARLQQEFGGVYSLVEAWSRRWMPRGAIEKEPAAFAGETRAIADALVRRIAAEHASLYDPLDALDV
jgi:hypothetical protein